MGQQITLGPRRTGPVGDTPSAWHEDKAGWERAEAVGEYQTGVSVRDGSPTPTAGKGCRLAVSLELSVGNLVSWGSVGVASRLPRLAVI